MIENLAPFYADFGLIATRASPAGTFRVLLDLPGDDEFGIATTRHTLRVPAAVALEEGQRLTIDATVYSVAAPPRATPDGLEVIAPLVLA